VWIGCSANRGRGGEVVAGVFAVYARGAGLEVEGLGSCPQPSGGSWLGL